MEHNDIMDKYGKSSNRRGQRKKAANNAHKTNYHDDDSDYSDYFNSTAPSPKYNSNSSERFNNDKYAATT